MSPLVAYHVTRATCRESIRANGLLPNRSLGRHPHGVYVFRWDGSFNHVGFSMCEWTIYHGQDLWRVAYIGPLIPDHYVLNGMILLGTVDKVTLVTGNEWNNLI